MKKTLLLLAAIGAVAFALVGCQPAYDGEGETTTTTTTTGNNGEETERETTRTTTPGGY